MKEVGIISGDEKKEDKEYNSPQKVDRGTKLIGGISFRESFLVNMGRKAVEEVKKVLR